MVVNWLKNIVAENSARQALRDNPILSAAVSTSARTFDDLPLKAHTDEDAHRRWAQQLMEQVTEVLAAKNPVRACREVIAALMYEIARYQVLIIPPPPAEDSTGLRGQPGITGELHEHLVEIVETDDDLRTELYGVAGDVTEDVAHDMCMLRYWKTYWWLTTFNTVRIGLKDCNESGRDWYKPFFHSQCAFMESVYRDKIGLPSAFGDGSNHLVGLMYSTFLNFVDSDAVYPDLAWRENYKEEIADGTLPLPEFTE